MVPGANPPDTGSPGRPRRHPGAGRQHGEVPAAQRMVCAWPSVRPGGLMRGNGSAAQGAAMIPNAAGFGNAHESGAVLSDCLVRGAQNAHSSTQSGPSSEGSGCPTNQRLPAR
jgi:hypothetical protein